MANELLEPTAFALDAVVDPENRAKRVLIIIHGIRDQPAWAAHFNNALADLGYDCTVAPVQYKRYSSLPFIFGTGLMDRRTDVLTQVREIHARNGGAVFDVFCHSNGTRLFGDIVHQEGVPNFQTVMLAGSVCQRLQVAAIATKVKTGRLWNICGKKDRWPILAQALRPDLFEQTGVTGFLDERVYDRYYNFGHSGALQPSFIHQVVVPMLMFSEAERHEGVPSKSALHDPATYRKIAAAFIGFAVFSLRFLPWWVAAIPCFWAGYLFYRWHDT